MTSVYVFKDFVPTYPKASPPTVDICDSVATPLPILRIVKRFRMRRFPQSKRPSSKCFIGL